jgi:hypothetical protein
MRAILLSLAALWCAAVQAAEPIYVTYPQPETATDMRSKYPQRILELALERAGGTYKLRLSAVRMQQGRALSLLKEGKGIDIVNFMTSPERERDFLPIRVETDKGMIGWRLLLVKRSQLAKFERITIGQLKELKAGQGADWPDTPILRVNGFAVHATSSYEPLFKLLDTGRIDYFPRSVIEIWAEADRYAAQDLVVEPSLALHYPAATYFFVNKNNPGLAAAIKDGLEKLVADGTLDKVYGQHYDDVIKRANLKQRRVFEMKNQ